MRNMTKKIGLTILSVIFIAVLLLILWDRDHWRDYKIVTRDDYTIERDSYGVPLIIGETDEAVAYGIAIAQAEDDFETLQQILIGVKRKAGAVSGRKGAQVDYLSYLLRTREVAHARYSDQLSPKTRAYIEAFADGLNAFAKQNPERVIRKDVFPVSGEDVAAGFVLTSPLFFGLDDVIGSLVKNETPAGTPLPLKGGSNAFAIAPSRSTDGMTRLVSNSHQPWEGPVAWYELRVESGEGWRFYGANFPGAPFPLMGHNDFLGWTNTVNRPDLKDVYRLILSRDKKKYKFGDEWIALEKQAIWLRVRWGPFTLPVRKILYRSVHGPVILNKQGGFAVRYPNMDSVRQVEQYLKLTQTRNWREWRDVMAMQAIPATNFIYADNVGNIALLYNAALPMRDPAYDWWEILPGDDPKALWHDLIPSERVPLLLNPAAGYIINANNTPFLATDEDDNLKPQDYTDIIGIEPYTTNRILRALDLFATDNATSPERLREIKYDKTYDKQAVITRLIMGAMALPMEGDLAEPVALLRQWDFTQDGAGKADALAWCLAQSLRLPGYQVIPPPDYRPLLLDCADQLRTQFGRLDVPLGEMLRLRRGNIDVPVTGGTDVLRAILWEKDTDGKWRANFGDSFIMFVTWDADGKVVESKTAQPFGTNVQDETTPHYNDQAVMFANEELKDTGFVTRVPLYERP